MTTKEIENELGRDTALCVDPKKWFPMRGHIIYAGDEGEGAIGLAGN